jgi:hypothetical protein
MKKTDMLNTNVNPKDMDTGDQVKTYVTIDTSTC